ncbi:MAG: GTP cyclohydrolase I FolE2 [Armatimonadota bacterium]|nr:GTP cyclohydrolase I FolE2 [Armatimonadota bacterium]
MEKETRWSLNTELERLADVQSETPEHEIDLTRVGVTNFRYPVLVRKSGENLRVFVTIEASVNLPPDQRGAHMSRFAEEIVSTFQMPMEADSYEDLAERLAKDILNAHDYAAYCTLRIEGESHREGHPYKIFATYNTATEEKSIGVEVVGALACPCAMAMTGGITHNQRGSLTVAVKTNGNRVNATELAALAEAAFSSPVRLLLKRPDEKRVVEQMHQNPRFVEDVVRHCVVALKEAYPGSWAKIRCVSMESIHPYDCFAEWEGAL